MKREEAIIRYRKCYQCGKFFTPSKYNKNTQIFCSKECQRKKETAWGDFKPTFWRCQWCGHLNRLDYNPRCNIERYKERKCSNPECRRKQKSPKIGLTEPVLSV